MSLFLPVHFFFVLCIFAGYWFSFCLPATGIISHADKLVFMFKVTPRVMLNCTTDHKDMRYCVSQGTCGTGNVLGLQCKGEPNRQHLPRTRFAANAWDSLSLLMR